MTTDLLTSREAATALDIPYSTLRGYAQRYKVPVADVRRGADMFDATGLDIIRRIKELVGKDIDGDSIPGYLAAEFPTMGGLSEGSEKSPGESLVPSVTPAHNLIDSVRVVLREESDLAEKYARATHTIGKLEEKVETLEKQQLLLPDSAEMQRLALEHQKLALEKLQLSETSERLQADLDALRERERQAAETLEQSRQAEREAYQKALALQDEKAQTEREASESLRVLEQAKTQIEHQLQTLSEGSERQAQALRDATAQAAAEAQAKQAAEARATELERERQQEATERERLQLEHERVLRTLQEAQDLAAAQAAELEAQRAPRGFFGFGKKKS